MTEEQQTPEEENGSGNLLDATTALVKWVSQMKKQYRLQESTIMDLFRIQLMWVEQQAQQGNRPPTGQELVDAIAAEEAERHADEVITADD